MAQNRLTAVLCLIIIGCFIASAYFVHQLMYNGFQYNQLLIGIGLIGLTGFGT
jgi:hypothetical protein